MPYSKWNNVHCVLFILAANILLTAWTVYVKPVLNYDGILYITTAQAIDIGDWQKASELYKGSLYPLLIQWSSKLSGLSIEYAAHALNALLLSVLSLAYIMTVRQLGGTSKRILWISCAIILFFPSLLKYRPFIIRDFGFLSCYLWSIFFLLKYQHTKHYKHLFLWAMILIFGAFLRIESLLFLILLSMLLLLPNAVKYVRNSNTKWLISTSLICLILIGIVLLFKPQLHSGESSSTLASLLNSLSYRLEYITRAISLLTTKLVSHNEQSGGIVMAIAKPIGSVLYETLKRLEVIYAVLAVIAYKMQLVLNNRDERKVITSYLLIGITVLILFEISLGYLTARYTMAIVLTILLLVPFLLEKMFNNVLSKSHSAKFGLAFLTLVLCFISVKRLVFSEQHVEATAGQWLVTNLPQNAVIASNNSKVLYYANRHPYIYFQDQKKHHRFDTRLLLSQRNKTALATADYLSFMVRTKDKRDVSQEALFTEQFGTPIARFEQHKGLYVNIYKLQVNNNSH